MTDRPKRKVFLEGFSEPPKDLKCPYFRDWMHKCCPKCVKWKGYVTDKNGAPSVTYNCADMFQLQFAAINAAFADEAGASFDKLTSVVANRAAAVRHIQLTRQPMPNGETIGSDPVKLIEHKEDTDAS